MNTIDFIESNPSLAEAQGKFLVFNNGLRNAIVATNNGQRYHIQPVQLTDGRWILNADIITEIQAGQIYNRLYGLLTKAAPNAGEVLTYAEIEPLLPTPEI